MGAFVRGGMATVADVVAAQAAAILAGVGHGQTWQNLIGSRVAGTNYVNTTGRPICVSASMTCGSAGSAITATIDGATVAYRSTSNIGYQYPIDILIPAGSTYKINIAGAGASLYSWDELR